MKIMSIVGARPQFIKAATISRAIKEYNSENQANKVIEIIVHTGQHYDYDMSGVFFEELDIPRPDYDLGVGSESHGQQTGRMLEAIEKVLEKERPNWVLVYGDTNSTLAGALAAVKMHMPVAHVEAGLRSFNRRMPEEINRVVTDHVSSLLFCPTETALKNLKQEGITKGVHNIGDVMYDSMLYYKRKLVNSKLILDLLELESRKFILATVHRAENTNSPERLKNIFQAFDVISKDLPLVVALHPRTLKYLKEYEIKVKQNIKLLKPLSYLQMIALEWSARLILTDSGGVQKEAFFAKTPCITLREETEWVETVNCGANVLAGAVIEKIIASYETFKTKDIKNLPNTYGDGKSSYKIVNQLMVNNL